MKKAIITVDLSFGDCGKGATVDYLAHKLNSKLVVRYGGGAQCAHNVQVGNLKHCFAQYGSGSFAGAQTLHLENVVINPWNYICESIALKKQFPEWNTSFINIHQDCLIATPFHIAANRIEERKNRHGSCGQGIWKTREYAERFVPLRARHLHDKAQTRDLLYAIQKNLQDSVEKDVFDDYTAFLYQDRVEELVELYYGFSQKNRILDLPGIYDLLEAEDNVIFEGHQGVLLDENYGFRPHVSGHTTTKQATNFLNEISYQGETTTLGIIRSYSTRHGAGPFPSYDPKINSLKGEENTVNEWQSNFKVGRFDLRMANYALKVQPVDGLVVSCLDNDPYDDYVSHYDSFVLSEVDLLRDTTQELNQVKAIRNNFNSKKGTINRAVEIAEMLHQELIGFSFSPDREGRFIKV